MQKHYSQLYYQNISNHETKCICILIHEEATYDAVWLITHFEFMVYHNVIIHSLRDVKRDQKLYYSSRVFLVVGLI